MLPPYLLKFHITPSCGKDDFDFALRADYAAGIKQSRDPKGEYATEGALFVNAETNPACASEFALPPNRTPRVALPLPGMSV